jgi:hypothetical protein
VEVVLGALLLAAILVVAGWVAGKWLSAQIQQATALSREKELEALRSDPRWEEIRRTKADRVADFLAAHQAQFYDSGKATDADHLLDLQRRYWALAIWLESDELEVLNRVCQQEAEPKQLVLATRGQLSGDVQSSDSQLLIAFPPPPAPEALPGKGKKPKKKKDKKKSKKK